MQSLMIFTGDDLFIGFFYSFGKQVLKGLFINLDLISRFRVSPGSNYFTISPHSVT